MAGNDPFLKKRTGKAETFESNLITQKESCHKQQNAHTSFFGLINVSTVTPDSFPGWSHRHGLLQACQQLRAAPHRASSFRTRLWTLHRSGSPLHHRG